MMPALRLHQDSIKEATFGLCRVLRPELHCSQPLASTPQPCTTA